MKLRRQVVIATSAILFLLLLFTSMSVAADVSGKTTNINISLTGDITGNKDMDDTTTNLPSDTNVPGFASSDNVFDNNAVIGGLGPTITVNGNIYGGYTRGTGNVYDNVVHIRDAIVNSGLVFWTAGGFSMNGDATDNKVYVYSTSTVGGTIYGGLATGHVTGNEVEISGTSNDVNGGMAFTGNGNINGNKVVISGSANGNVYGGNSQGNGNVNDNIVEISGTVNGGVSGARSTGTGNVIGNSVVVSGTTHAVSGAVTLGSGKVADNSVVISGTANGNVYGGLSTGTGDVTNNSVEISGTGTAMVEGGHGNSSIGGITDNKVVVTSTGTAGHVSGGSNMGSADITGNSVEISGTVLGIVRGGYAFSGGSGNITDNKIEVSGTADRVFGGWSTGAGNINNNTIEISGTVDIVVGGLTVGNGNITDNTIEISGTVTSGVYSGFTTGSGMVQDNTVTILDTANLTGASLYGFNSGANGSNNTLNVDGFCGDVATIANFDTYNFVLGQLTSNHEFLVITGTPVDIDGTTINIDFSAAFSKNSLNGGDEIKVITDINTPLVDPTVTVASSPYLLFDYTATWNTNALLLKLHSASLQPQTEALSEGFAAGMAFLGQAADVRSGINFVPQNTRFIPFAKMVYSKQHISTGSSINVKGFSALAGLALNTNFDNGSQLVVGAFVEGGWGDYDSRNSFSNSASVKGKGDTEYYGGGVLARYALKNGLYSEGTFAAGKTETDYRSWDFAPGTKTKYDSSVPYYSAHLALGKIFNMCDIFNLDVYGKYLWTRQAGDNVNVDGYRIKYKDTDSHRVRVGSKLQSTALLHLQPYAGAAFEYEFSGKVKGSLSGMNLGTPSLRGGTGIGELGLVWSPTESGSFKVDLGAQGYVGKREGVSGGLTVTMSF